MINETEVETVETENTQEKLNVQETETKETETKTQEIKTFTKEEVDRLVKGRLGREREYFAKSLGLENYDDINSKIEEFKTIKETLTQKEEALKLMDETVETLQSDVIKYKLQIKEDKYKEAMALAKVKQENGMQLEEALTEVLKEYPSMKNGVSKLGEEPGRQGKTDKPVYTRAFLEQFQNIPYYKQLLDDMKKGDK